MKILITALAVFFLSGPGLVGTSAAAAEKKEKESATEKYERRRNPPKNSGPCRVVKNACVHAGFKKDGPRGKDLKKDCEEMLLMGHSVAGVHLIPGIIASCKQATATETQAEDAK